MVACDYMTSLADLEMCSPCSSRTLTSIEESDVYRMLQKDQEEPQEPRQSGSFKALQDFVDSDGKLIISPLNKCNFNILLCYPAHQPFIAITVTTLTVLIDDSLFGKGTN